MHTPTPKDLRAAQLAHVLARGVRDGEVDATDALRVLKHELRRRNTNTSVKIPRRSHAAQASIEKYAPDPPPKNSSPDALHADHVYPLTSELLHTVVTVEEWIVELARLRAVVCVTAHENYALQKIESRAAASPVLRSTPAPA